MKVRLKTNMIIGGRFVPFGSILDEAEVPERLRNADYIVYDLKAGQAMTLRELNYTISRTDHEGFAVKHPVMLAAGELVDPKEIPTEWQEGVDYKFDWSPEERRAVQAQEQAKYLEHFQPEAEPQSYEIGR